MTHLLILLFICQHFVLCKGGESKSDFKLSKGTASWKQLRWKEDKNTSSEQELCSADCLFLHEYVAYWYSLAFMNTNDKAGGCGGGGGLKLSPPLEKHHLMLIGTSDTPLFSGSNYASDGCDLHLSSINVALSQFGPSF